MRRFASASPTCIALPAFQSSAERIALGAERQSLHDAFKRETPPLIVDTARDSPVDWIAAELAVAEDRSWPGPDDAEAAVGPRSERDSRHQIRLFAEASVQAVLVPLVGDAARGFGLSLTAPRKLLPD